MTTSASGTTSGGRSGAELTVPMMSSLPGCNLVSETSRYVDTNGPDVHLSQAPQLVGVSKPTPEVPICLTQSHETDF